MDEETKQYRPVKLEERYAEMLELIAALDHRKLNAEVYWLIEQRYAQVVPQPITIEEAIERR